jgi:very-short-patch-repair endonuclease
MPDNKNRSLTTSGYHLSYNPKLVEKAREIRKNPTPAEEKLWYGFLRTFKHRVLRQRPIDNFNVDFYCAKLKLVIEIDGDTHSTDEENGHDRSRIKVLEGYGLKVVRFTNMEVLRNFEAVCATIERIPPTPLKRGAKNCWRLRISFPPLIRGARGDLYPDDKPLEISPFREIERHRVIGRLVQALQDPGLDPGIQGSPGYDFLKKLGADAA